MRAVFSEFIMSSVLETVVRYLNRCNLPQRKPREFWSRGFFLHFLRFRCNRNDSDVDKSRRILHCSCRCCIVKRCEIVSTYCTRHTRTGFEPPFVSKTSCFAAKKTIWLCERYKVLRTVAMYKSLNLMVL